MAQSAELLNSEIFYSVKEGAAPKEPANELQAEEVAENAQQDGDEILLP
jgi:hypothetical protein